MSVLQGQTHNKYKLPTIIMSRQFMEQSEQIKWNVRQYLPSRAKNGGTHPTVSSMGAPKPKEDQWTFRANKPAEIGDKLLMAAERRYS